MKRSCPYCGRIHDIGYVCLKKPKKDYSRYIRDKGIDKFRWTKAWQSKRTEIGQRDMWCCVICARNLYNTIGRQYNYDDISCHHIEPLVDRYDLRLDNDNLIDVCKMHHSMCEDGTIPKDIQRAIAKEQNDKLETKNNT